MKTTPTYQPPGEPYDGKPRVVVLVEDLDKLHIAIIILWILCVILLALLLTGCSSPSQSPITTQPFNYMQYMISNGYVYQTNVVTTNEVWKAK